MDEFYCSSCGQHKNTSCMRARPAGRTPICASCEERAKKRIKLGDKQRDAKRRRTAEKKTISHLLPHNYDL